jgi:hypothetical protein
MEQLGVRHPVDVTSRTSIGIDRRVDRDLRQPQRALGRDDERPTRLEIREVWTAARIRSTISSLPR